MEAFASVTESASWLSIAVAIHPSRHRCIAHSRPHEAASDSRLEPGTHRAAESPRASPVLALLERTNHERFCKSIFRSVRNHDVRRGRRPMASRIDHDGRSHLQNFGTSSRGRSGQARSHPSWAERSSPRRSFLSQTPRSQSTDDLGGKYLREHAWFLRIAVRCQREFPELGRGEIPFDRQRLFKVMHDQPQPSRSVC